MTAKQVRIYFILFCGISLCLVLVSIAAMQKHVIPQQMVKKSVEPGQPNIIALSKHVMDSSSSCETTSTMNFSFLIVPERVKSMDTNETLLIYVFTTLNNRGRRDDIRQTWANHLHFKDCSWNLHTVFVLGIRHDDLASVKEEYTLLAEESKQHGDMLVGNFVDSYANLTVKGVYVLEWLLTSTHTVPFFLKTDDDVFINSFAWLNYASSNSKSPIREAAVSCYRWRGQPVTRAGRWGIPVARLPARHLPRWCSGTAYLLPRAAASQLRHASPCVPRVGPEDVYWTGLVARRAGVRLMAAAGMDRLVHSVSTIEQFLVNSHVYWIHYLHGLLWKQAWVVWSNNTCSRRNITTA